MMQKVMEEAIWRSVCDNCPSLSSLSTNDGDGTGKNLANIGPGSSCVIPSTALTNSVKRQPSLKDHGHMLHFDNFRTFYINGSLTLVVNDLNLDKIPCGDMVKILEDRWFPLPTRFWIFSLKPLDHVAHFVYDLIDDSQNWNVSLLKFLFSDPDDCLLWHFDKKGNFSVRSANAMAQDYLASYRDKASSSPTPNTFGEILKKIWAAKVPPNKSEDSSLEN
ncbi:hypothetical protein ACFX2I_037756 [Malus domestica]